MPARRSAASIARRAPPPAGSGSDMWWPSDDTPQPHNATAAGSRLHRNSAAPSPRLMPLRVALNGLHGAALTESRAEKPATVKPHSVSTPHVTTASHSPMRIRRAALASAFALDEQALEWT